MKAYELMDAIGEVDDAYIHSAEKRLEGGSEQTGIYRRGIARRFLLTAATVFLLLVSSFTVAMAANEEFRNAVFRFFHISTPDVNLPMEGEPDQSGLIQNIGSTGIENVVHTEYIRLDSKFDYNGGIIYLYDEETERYTQAYTVEDGQLCPLEAHFESFEYTWDGFTYQISFDWYEANGTLHAMGRHYDLDTGTDWGVGGIKEDKVFVWLSAGSQIDYHMYVLLYNIRTHEVIDVLDGCKELKSQNILDVEFSSDRSAMLVTCGEVTFWYDENSSRVYYYEIGNGTVQDLDELSGMRVMGASFMDDDTVCCYWEDEEGLGTRRILSLSTGEVRELYSDMPGARWSDYGVIFTGSRYGLYVDETGGVNVYDFKTGEMAAVEGFQYYEDVEMAAINGSGNKILFFKTDASAEGLGVSSIGILDLEKHSFILFDREGYDIRYETTFGWFDNDRVAITAHTDEYGYLYIISVEESAAGQP